MRHADLLAALRKPRNDDDIKAQLQAMTVPMHEHDPICVILDRAIRAIEDHEECLRAVAEMRADDLDRYVPNAIGAEDRVPHYLVAIAS